MRPSWILAILLGLAGCLLLLVANEVPAHSNRQLFLTDLEWIETQRAANNFDDATASRRFHALQEQQSTNKWPLTDLGYLSLSLAAFLGLLSFWFAERLSLQATRTHTIRTATLLVLCVPAMTFVAGLVSAHQTYWRGLFPPWADTLAIAYAETAMLSIGVLAVLALLILPVHFLRRRAGSSLFAISRPPLGVAAAANLFYFPMACIATFLAVAFSAESGGWMATPAFLLAAWLFLHARGVLLAPPKGSLAVEMNGTNA